MIQLTIDAATTDDLHQKLKGILYGLAAEPAAAIADTTTKAEPEKATRTRKPKDEPAKPEPTTETTVLPPAKPEIPPEFMGEAGVELVRKALQSYGEFLMAAIPETVSQADASMQVRNAIVEWLTNKCKAAKASEVPAEQRQAIVAELKALIAPADTTATPTLDDMRAALKKLGSDKGADAVFALLGQFDAKTGAAVPEDKRAAVIAAVNKLLEG